MGSKAFNGEVWTNTHPDLLRAMMEANLLPVDGKTGDDSFTRRARELMLANFSTPVYPIETVNGTAANNLAMKCMLPAWGSVLCADVTHVNTYECAAAEYNLGAKILTCPSRDGKLTPAQVCGMLEKSRSFQYIPSLLVLTQPTEFGVLYSGEELASLVQTAHENGMSVYLDGARLPYALAALHTDMKAMIEKTDMDAFSFGGTKCAAMFGEMVVFRRLVHAEHLPYLQKQTMQHFDKSKFLGVQLLWLLENERWRGIVQPVNERARLLARKLAQKGILPVFPVDTNMVFCTLEAEQLARVNTAFDVHYWDCAARMVRFCVSHETTEQMIDQLVNLL